VYPAIRRYIYKEANRRYGKGDFQGSIRYFNYLLRLSPRNPRLYYDRGLANHRMKHISQAADDFSKAIVLSPEYAGAFSARGHVYQDKGDLERAIADYSEAVRLNPQSILH